MDAPLVVAGAGAAGLSVVDALRRQGYTEPIVLIGDEGHPPYDRPPLSKGFLLGTVDRDRIALREPAALERLDVDLRLGRRASGLDLRERVVHLDDGSALTFSQLVVATGVRSARPRGFIDAACVLRTIDDAEELASRLRTAESVAVIGGGLLGYELAAAARAAGRAVTLVDRAAVPLSRVLGTVVGDIVGQVHREHGVDLRNGRSVRTVTRHVPTAPAALTLDDGSSLRAGVVIAAVGSHPNVEWLAGNGLDLRDGVGCDWSGRAAAGVYAIGDVARWGAGQGGVRVEHRTNATEQALAVAQHITQGTQAPPLIPYFWTDQFGERIQVAGRIRAGTPCRVIAGDIGSRRFLLRTDDDGEPGCEGGGAIGGSTGLIAWRMAKDFARHRADLAREF